MRFVLEFNLKSEQFPKDYRPVCISYLKKMVEQVNGGQFFSRFFGSAGGEKPYTFSVHFSNPIFKKDSIIVENKRVRLIFSTSDEMTALVFHNAFLQNVKRPFPLPLGNVMILHSLRQKYVKKISQSSIVIKMLSPLCIREHAVQSNKDRYYSINDNNFDALASSMISLQLEKAGVSTLKSRVCIKSLQVKKTVVLHHGMMVECSLGTFQITGDPSVLQLLYTGGMGSRKSAGFGMFDIVYEVLHD